MDMSTSVLAAPPVRVTFKQWCEREGIAESTGRDWVAKGLAPRSYLFGRRRVFNLDEVLRWEADLETQGVR